MAVLVAGYVFNLMVQHFLGPLMDNECLTANWTSTAT